MLLLLLAACFGPSSDDDRTTYGDDSASGDDTGGGTGDTDDGEAEVYPWRDVLGVQAAESPEVGGGIDVTWTGEDDARYFLEFGYDESYGQVVPVEPGDEPHAVVMGMKQKSLVHARVITVLDGVIWAGDDFTFTTPALPAGFPGFSLNVPADASLDPHFTLLTLFSGANGKSSVFAVDADGDVVWWVEKDAMFIPGAHVRPDRSGVVYRVDDQWGLTFGEVVSVDFDGSARIAHPDPYGHHDTYPHEDGSVATFVADVCEWNGEDLAGDTLVEIAPDGTRAPVFADGGLWLFDNHSNFSNGTENASRVVRYALDDASGSAALAWEWFDTQARIMTDVMGDVRPLAGGNLLTTWGTVGRAAILSERGEKLWEIQADPGLVIGRGDVFSSFYGPSPVVITAE